MLVLALDTATPDTAVALLDDDEVLEEACEPSRNHSRTLLPAIDALLARRSLDREALGAVGVGVGPGSFTGTRVGMALAKTLAFSLGIPIVGVSTLHAIAEGVRDLGPARICPVLDALKQEVYVAEFLRSARELERARNETACDPRGWAERLPAEGSCLLVGNGALRYRDVFTAVLGKRAIIPAGEQHHRMQASALGRLARFRLARGERDNPRTLEPNYCRLSEAELASRRARD